MTAVSPDLIAAFAPSGTLRAAINTGNPILAHADAGTGSAGGVSVDIARALAARLGVPLTLVVVDAAGKSVQTVEAGDADVGFFAIDPVRGANIAFTNPYVLIEGAYLVRNASPLTHNDEVDRPGIRVTVGKGSAYDLFLTRHLQAAEIVRAPTSPTVVDTFLEQGLDVAAGVRQQLEADAGRVGGVRLLPGRFMVIEQAMGVPKARGQAAAHYLREFIESLKANGAIAQALERHQIQGASVAPAA